MDSTAPRRPMNPMTIAEMLPALSGILSKNDMQSLTSKKQPRHNLPVTRTTEKIFKPMTIAEMRASQAIIVQSPRRYAQGASSTKKKGAYSTKKKWNSSVKVEKKTVSRTANGEMEHNTVKKALNFQQPKPKIPVLTFTRMTMNPEKSPKFPKPEIKAKTSVHLQAAKALRISGVCHLPETPLLPNKPLKNRISTANKENICKSATKKNAYTPKSSVRKRVIPDTPLLNESWKSSCDDSFLQNEEDIEIKTKALVEEQSLENITDISPVSTPSKEYRLVKKLFNKSSDIIDNSMAYHDNKTSASKENSKKVESDIVSLSDMLRQTTLSESHAGTELDHLLELKRQTLKNLEMIDSAKESQMKSLQYLNKLISEKQKEQTPERDNNETVTTKDTKMVTATPKMSPMLGKPCSVLKSCLKSPSYKIPRKYCMRKKVAYSSLPNVSNLMLTPPKDMGDRALSMYLKMKERMNFLNTPVAKQRQQTAPDTPAITSHNLQKQLDKLYGDE